MVWVWATAAAAPLGIGKVSDAVWTDDETLVACDLKGHLIAFGADGRAAWKHRLPERVPCSVALGSDGLLATSGPALVLVDPSTGAELRRYDGEGQWQWVSVLLAGHSRTDAFGQAWGRFEGRKLIRLDGPEIEEVATTEDFDGWDCVQTLPDRHLAIIRGRTGPTILDSEAKHEISRGSHEVWRLAGVGADVLTTGPDGVYRWPIQDGQLGTPVLVSDQRVAFLELDLRAERIYWGDAHGTIGALTLDGSELWRTTIDEPRKASPVALALTPDGSTLAIGDRRGLTWLRASDGVELVPTRQ